MTYPKAFYEYCKSFVESVDKNELLKEFVNLNNKRLFIVWENTENLNFIEELKQYCEVKTVSNSYHFPNYDNPNDLYKIIYNFLSSVKN